MSVLNARSIHKTLQIVTAVSRQPASVKLVIISIQRSNALPNHQLYSFR